MKVKNPRLVRQLLEEGAPLDLLRRVVPDLPPEGLEEGRELLRQATWPEDVFDGERLFLRARTPAQRALLQRL
jgi:hypothetical protein